MHRSTSISFILIPSLHESGSSQAAQPTECSTRLVWGFGRGIAELGAGHVRPGDLHVPCGAVVGRPYSGRWSVGYASTRAADRTCVVATHPQAPPPPWVYSDTGYEGEVKVWQNVWVDLSGRSFATWWTTLQVLTHC